MGKSLADKAPLERKLYKTISRTIKLDSTDNSLFKAHSSSCPRPATKQPRGRLIIFFAIIRRMGTRSWKKDKGGKEKERKLRERERERERERKCFGRFISSLRPVFDGDFSCDVASPRVGDIWPENWQYFLSFKCI